MSGVTDEGGLPVVAVRPAILIGYGDFGHTVIRRLLTSASLRGSLEWIAPGGGASPAERQLRDLAPIHLDDPLAGPRSRDPRGRDELSGFQVMEDLYRQVATVPAGEHQAEHLADAAQEGIERLLAAPVLQRRGGRPGVDVFVLSQPRDARAINTLDRLVRPLMERLADPVFLRHNRRTSYVSILDFTSYWGRSSGASQRRRVLRKSVDRWRARRHDGKPAFDRFYLVDGRAEAGVADERRRIEEIGLLLELMLFEGQRGELQRLFQVHDPGESPVYSFGLRVMERRAGLLSRRAAAEFGRGWLRYLAGSGAEPEQRAPRALRECLDRYSPEALEAALHLDGVRAVLYRDLEALETDLTATLDRPADDWPGAVRERFEDWETSAWRRLSDAARERMVALRRDHLSRLESDLAKAIEADLHRPDTPVPLGAVLDELDEALETLDGGPSEGPARRGRDLGRALRAVGRRYRRFVTERLHLTGLQLFWPLLALATATGAAPLLTELLRDIPSPGSQAPFLWTPAWAVAQWAASPLVTGPAVFAATWAIGALWIQRRFRGRLARGERVFLDPDQGMLVDRIREALAPGGSLRAPIEERLERRLEDMVQAARSGVRREVGRVRKRLEERRRELDWLRNRLEEFETVHGGDAGGAASSDVRIAVEGPDDYRRMLRSNPPEAARFRSAQSSRQPFRGWDDPWCDAFLHPLDFIDRLSALYRDPFDQELARPEIGPEQELWADCFVRFVEDHGSAPLTFHWDRQEGLPPEERFCLLPPLWHRLRGVQEILLDHKVGRDRMLPSHEVGRAFLLRIQGGVDPRCLTEVEDLEETA